MVTSSSPTFVLPFTYQMPSGNVTRDCASALGSTRTSLSDLAYIVSRRLMPLISSCEIQPCCFSDHDFVVLSVQPAGDHTLGPGLWKFNNCLLSDESQWRVLPRTSKIVSVICYNTYSTFRRSSSNGFFQKFHQGGNCRLC